MGTAIGLIGIMAGIVSLIWLIVAAIKHLGKKKPLIGVGASIVLLIVGVAITPSNPNNSIVPVEPTGSETQTETPKKNVETVSDATIQIDENNSMKVSITLEDGAKVGYAVCDFDGTDAISELEYITAAIFVFGKLDISDYGIAGFSGEDLITITEDDEGQAQYLAMPSGYGTLETNTERISGYADTMLNALGGKTESESEPSQKPKQPKETKSDDSDITTGQKNALKSAKSYLSYAAFSYKGLVKQLEYEKFSNEDSVYAADNCGADWNEQAAKQAKAYLDYTSFSKDGLIEQLEYEGFTHEQAVYGAKANGY